VKRIRDSAGFLRIAGRGSRARTKKHLFERGYGKNTGPGLFLSLEILSITGIAIRETSDPGNGVRFEMIVPKGGYRFTKKIIP